MDIPQVFIEVYRSKGGFDEDEKESSHGFRYDFSSFSDRNGCIS